MHAARHIKDDSTLLEDIRQVVCDLGTYGYRRVWGVLRHQPVDANRPTLDHKTVYRVMRDHGCCCIDMGNSLSTRAGMMA